MCVCVNLIYWQLNSGTVPTVEQWNSERQTAKCHWWRPPAQKNNWNNQFKNKIKNLPNQLSCHNCRSPWQCNSLLTAENKCSRIRQTSTYTPEITMNRGQWTAEQKPSALSKMSKLLLNIHVRPLFDKDLSHRAMQHPSRPKTFHNRVASISMKASESQSVIKACLLHLQVELPWCQPLTVNALIVH